MLQEEEWQVLESIYPDCLSSNLPDRVKKLEIPVEFGDARTVSVVGDGSLVSAELLQDTPIHRLDPISISIASLPPVLLYLVLPPTYPLLDPPQIVSLHVTWLPHTAHFQDKLLEMWEPGDGTLYNWIEWIRTAEFLNYFSFIDGQTIRILHEAPHLLAPLLTSHDANSKSSQFAQNSYTCSICLTSHKGAKCLMLVCGHVFCRPCLEDYWKLFIKEGDVARVGCPDPACVKQGRESHEEEVRRVVSEDEASRWRWLREKRVLDQDPTIVHCPMALCQAAVPKPNNADEQSSGWERLRTCQSCDYSFCAFCKRTWHGPLTDCPIPIAENFVLEYMSLADGSPSRAVLEQRYGKANITRLVAKYKEDQANREWLESSTMACPGCQIKVEKSIGCNHMTCAKCKQHFCYRCGAKLNANNPYEHFSTPGRRCYSKLFDYQSVDDEWQPMEGFDAAGI
ncbi:hypothetical protein HETIRDRAFT_378542 [Heterobasidion irregulare TC 32-1]|uniref:RBR-type E3 ubiquitin transferase n=1 Tax=Heterobasidion irregulare (strain TC 32-1) TaxID=747525 RepID=W4KNT2_HETIT|nr:uncharacterized protein HETIRDRAFT_378542 [Heterobasidion irregulare TC 32-1]ETW87498.1 hypothetical protein HETIRDRAFT_378542 [Heterobasidion irregulare TC 32-1]